MLATALRTTARLAVPRVAAPALRVRAVPAMGMRFYSSELNKSALPFTHSANPTIKYSEEHEWIAAHEDGTAFIGITKYAADALGDATYVEVPEEGREFEKGESIGSVESVKSASELYSPVSGEVIRGNEELADNPATVNSDPAGDGWFAHVKLSDKSELDELMSIEAYEEFIKN
ncbi:hypothetical protein TRICI_002925 [Trichomonascus ciferrii]|uniref:Glycine cleavage system H protein n=1 Tax=Trichomonascus ciferrii TaxID=44093 RepID=A0A642V5J8_9ASCO|nr:hypothetical protein TRICI_002925 [Trichomonascus ciferrii]